ncbi:MAG: 2-C-methyl-D-erythritol 2,4-cyclodiphosphate synthase, partial [Chloroflexota bacterium]
DSGRAGFEAREREARDPAGARGVRAHAGARPVVDAALIGRVTDAASLHGAAIPVLPVVETVKRLDGDRIAATVDRSSLAVAQTPQGVRRDVFRQALEAGVGLAGEWTDEAAMLEAGRIAVHVVPGDPSNLKVTIPGDLARAAAHLAPAGGRRRVGIGHDSHPFGPSAPLRLGGVEFPGVPRLAGHSDGDVLLHAIADGLLGAAALGDLGRVFPADASTPERADSGDLLAAVLERLATAGWWPAAVDVTVIGARPRLGRRLDEIRERVAALLRLPVADVSIKASSGNLDGSDGAGRTMSTLALVTIEHAP